MPENNKFRIATLFPSTYETNRLDLEISIAEYKTFKEGIYATSMDEKWNVFVLDDIIYFARSWTDNCIFKVFVRRAPRTVVLTHFQVNRLENQYNSTDIDQDTILLRKLLQNILKREDFYSYPELELPLIKRTIEAIDPNNECKKSIGSNNVGLTIHIHDALTTDEQKQHVEVIGWTDLRKRIAGRNREEPLISLYLQNRLTNSGTTYYFDQNAGELLGQIIIRKNY